MLEVEAGESIITATNIGKMWEMIKTIDNISNIVPADQIDYDYNGCKVCLTGSS